MSSSTAAPSPQPQSGFHIDFDPVHRVLRVSPFGVVTDEIVANADKAVRQFLADEGAEFGIFDYSAAAEVRVTTGYVKAFAELAAPARPMKLRIAVAPQAALYGLNRMCGMLIEGKRSDFQVVRSMKEAEDLIGLGSLDFSRRL